MAALPLSSDGLIKQIDGFIQFLESRNASFYTIQSYKRNLSKFHTFLLSNSLLQSNEVTLLSVVMFKKHIQSKSPRSQFSYLITVRSFLKWSNEQKFSALDYTLVTLPKIKSNKKVFVKGAEIDQALISINIDQFSGQRDKAIMEVLVATGIRVSELVSLNREDVDYVNKKIAVGGKKDRVVNLSVRAINCLSNYLNLRYDKTSPLFISVKGKKRFDDRMTTRSVQRLVKKYALITPTILRRSFAVDLLQAGESMVQVQKMLGQKHLY